MCPYINEPYYLAYDKRYKSVYEQGADRYGLPDEEEKVRAIVRQYVVRFHLEGQKVVEFGCGEGISGLEFAKLGCTYTGYDVSSAAIEKASTLLSSYPDAGVFARDAVLDDFPKKAFDAGIDISCLHILVTDADRRKYLKNVSNCLKHGAPMYFVHAIYRNDAYEGKVTDYEQWLKIFEHDVVVPRPRKAQKNGKEIPVKLSLIPYRPRTEHAYRAELEMAGFYCLEFEKSDRADRADILVKRL
jgi:cyclopropane fatty-acyl-phospholipid synthase-like methyltransferase